MKRKFLIFSLLKVSNMFLVLYILGLISKKLNLENFGNFSLIQSFINITIGFLFSWSSSLILFFGVQEKDKQGNMREVIWIRNKILLCVTIILTLGFIFLKNNLDEYLKINSILIYFIIIFKVFNEYMAVYLLSIKKKIESVFLQFLLKITLAIYITCFNLSLNKLIVLSLLIETIGLLFIFFIDKNDFKKPDIFNKKLQNRITLFLKWQFLGFLGLSLTNYGDNFIIKSLYSFEEIGFYSRAYTFFLGMDSIIGVVTSYMNPEIISAVAKKNKKKLSDFFNRDRYIIFIIFSILNITLIILAPIIFTILYSDNISKTILIFRILSIGSIIRVWLNLYNVIFNISNNFKYLQQLNIVRGVLNLLFSYILIKKIGVVGAAYATIFTLILIGVILSMKGEKIIKEIKIELNT
ncbi:lipopolysaccharide biosynthesis protein [Cetobacterium sp.]|uniref:lipopolysaccharide biosynthesis protein n=1 Tax=Cetobacterium sp. TaxID=2071632 RepID=UPI003F35DE9D